MTHSSSRSSISLRAPVAPDRDAVQALLQATDVFRAEEVVVALEVFDGSFSDPDYLSRVVTLDDRVVGLALWGPAPMTLGTFDLYWIAAHPEAYGTGAAQALFGAVVRDVRERRGRLLLVETESTEAYARARRFYEREGMREIARIPDYYRPGADKVVTALSFEVEPSTEPTNHERE